MAHHVHVPRVAVAQQREQRRQQRDVPQEQTPAVRRDQRREQRDECVRDRHGRVRVGVDGVQLEFREVRRRERLAHGRAGRLDQAPRRRGDERGENRGVAAAPHRRQSRRCARAVSRERGERAKTRLHHLFRDARALVAERAEQLRDELGLVRGEERRHRRFGGLVRTPARVALGGGAVNLQEHNERVKPEQRRATRLRGIRRGLQPRQPDAREQREAQARGDAVRFCESRGGGAVALAGRRERCAIRHRRASPRGPEVTEELILSSRAVERELYLPQVGDGGIRGRARGAAPRGGRLPAAPRRAPRRCLLVGARRLRGHAEDADRASFFVPFLVFLEHARPSRVLLLRRGGARGVRGEVRQVAAEREQTRPHRRRRAEAVSAASRRAASRHRQKPQRVQRHLRVVATQQQTEVLARVVHVLVRAVLQNHARRADDPARRLRRERGARESRLRRIFFRIFVLARRDVRLEERVEVVQDGNPVHQVALRVCFKVRRGRRGMDAEGRCVFVSARALEEIVASENVARLGTGTEALARVRKLTVRARDCARKARKAARGAAAARPRTSRRGFRRDARRRRTFPKVHAKGGNTSASCNAGVATILSTMSFTLPGCSRRGEGSDEIWVRARRGSRAGEAG